MTDELKGILNQIDEFLLKNDNDSLALWDVLSALRGPDNGEYEQKLATTSIIRTKAFPKTAALTGSSIPATFGSDNLAHVEYRENNENTYDHFYQHVRQAFAVLGLTWNKENANDAAS